MPELPEVETVITAVAKAIGFSNIIDVTVNNNRFREKIPDDFAQKICRAKIIGYQRLSKYMVLTLDNGLSLIWHLGMSGKVKICSELPQHLEKHDHVVLHTSNGYLIFNDARRFGLLTYWESDKLKENPYLCHIGVDPFSEELSESYLHNHLCNKKVPIKIALLDQTIVAGIGNIYASEILYRARISPLRLSCDIKRKECQTLINETRNVLHEAILAGGSTIHDYQKPDGSLGYFQNSHCVYNKKGQQCPHCTCHAQQTGGIQKITQGGRSTFYCPVLQK